MKVEITHNTRYGRRRDEKEYQESDRNIYFDWTVPTVVYSQSNDLWPVGKHYWNFNISHFSIFVLLSSFSHFRRLISMLTFRGDIKHVNQNEKRRIDKN